MKKLLTIFLFGMSFLVSAQIRFPGTLTEKHLSFGGFVGHKDQVPIGEMATGSSIDKLKEISCFFGGDTLNGFDFEVYTRKTFVDGIKLLSEYKSRMRSYQIEFVKNKFNLKKIQKFEKENNYRTPVFPSVQTSGCNNMDFEDGNLGGWTASSGENQNSNAAFTVMGAGLVSTNEDIYSCNDVNLINNLYGNDAIGLPGLDPLGGTTSVRLGGYSMNVSEAMGYGCPGYHWSMTYSNGEMISKTVAVTAGNALMAYDYEVVLNDGGHLNGEQPYFHVFITDLSGTVLSTCTEYYVQAIAGNPPVGFVNSGYVNSGDNSIIYMKPWTSNSINLTPYIGQNVIVSFVAAGCIWGGHFAYAYVDAMCGPVEVIASNNAPCSGTNVILTAPSVQNGTYSWTGPGISGSTTNQTVTVTTSGTYIVTITPSQGPGCAYTISKVITFLPSPTASITPIAPVICEGGIVALNGNPTGGSGIYISEVWTDTGAGSLSATNIANPNFSNSIAGSYPLTFTVTDDQGCIGTASTVITVNGNPTPSITPNPASICAGAVLALNGNPAGGSGTYTSTVWTDAGALSLSATNIATPTFTNSVSGAYPLTFTVTDNNGCIGSTNAVVTVNPNPVPTITTSGPTTFCSGGNVTLDAGAGYTIYSWSNGTTSQTTSITLAGIYSVTVTDANGCTGTSATSITVTVNPNPLPAITVGPLTICAGGSVTLDAGSGYNTYAWSNGAFSQTATISTSGSYSVTVTDANGCSGLADTTITVTVNPTLVPVITATGATTFCSGGNVTLDAGAGYATYTWSNGASTQTIDITSSGSYSVTVTDANGCSGSSVSSTAITVNPSPTPSIASSGPTAFCAGGNVSLDAGAGFVTYVWSNGDTIQTINLSTAGSYSITVTDANGCTGSSAISLTVNPLPVADTSAVVISIANCGASIGAVTGIIMTSGTPAFNYIWYNADGNIVGNGSSDLTNVGNGVYSLTITDANGCSTSVGPFSITSTPGVTAAFTSDPATGESPLTVNFTNESVGATNYLWQFGTGDTSSVTNPSYIYIPLGDFTACLIANNAIGCYDTACSVIDIYLNSVFIIPNIFTPNDDNINDIFTIQCKGLIKMDAEIYNRWGQKECEWHTINGGWDGRSASGIPASEGTYFFIITASGIDGKEYLKKGAFNLTRGKK